MTLGYTLLLLSSTWSLVPIGASPAATSGPRFGFELPSPLGAAHCLAERSRAGEALRAGSWAEAVSHSEDAVAAFPHSHADWLTLARAQARLGQLEAALKSLRRASELGSMNVAEASTDPSLEPLHQESGFRPWLDSLSEQRQRRFVRYSPAELGKSRVEIDHLGRVAHERLTEHEALLGRVMAGDAMEDVARWRAASLEALAAQTDNNEVRWSLLQETLQSLVQDSRAPLTLSLASEVLRVADLLGVAESPHWVEAAHARAEARWAMAVVDSWGGEAIPAANRQYRADLLALAAGASDQVALEPVLERLVGEMTADLPVATRILRRLLSIASDRETVRQRIQLAAPGVLLASEGLPAFAAVTTTGRTVSNETLRDRVTLLHFWATWCPPCRPGLPKLREVQRDYGELGLEVIGVASEIEDLAEPPTFAAWCKENEVTWPQVLDTGPDELSLSVALGFQRIPHLIVVDQRGRVAAVARSADDLRPTLDSLLRK